MNTKYAIFAKNLTKTFSDKPIVTGIDLAVKPGEIYSFLGPNGAGKSTTIKMLVTLLDPTAGEIYILGQDAIKNSASVRLNIGVALQEASLDEAQTGLEFLHMQGRLYGLNKTQIETRIKELQQLIDIGDSLQKQIKTYSGGMKRRLDLAGSIFHKPQVLFLDEPTTGLDPISRNKVWEEIKRLNAQGMTIFLTTQYLEEADVLADRVAILNGGKIVIEGSPEDLKNNIGQDSIMARVAEPEKVTDQLLDEIQTLDMVTKTELYNKELNISAGNGSVVIGKIAVILDKHDIQVESLLLRGTTLDDVFLEVTGERIETH
jgi:ABC-2 type transport system ATP-binding protein